MADAQKYMPFTFIRHYFEGKPVKTVLVGERYQLQAGDGVLSGLEGNPYTFESEKNAEYWLESNLIRTAQEQKTDGAAIDRLLTKKANMQEKKGIDAYWIGVEITQILKRNQQAEGEASGVWHTWKDLFIDGGNAHGATADGP